MSSGSIVQQFKQDHNCFFVIHFDESDKFLECAPKAGSTEQILVRFYEVWGELDTIARAGCTCYVSGRDPLLMLVGKGLLRNRGKISYGDVCPLFLDALKERYLANIMHPLCHFESVDDTSRGLVNYCTDSYLLKDPERRKVNDADEENEEDEDISKLRWEGRVVLWYSTDL